MGAGICTHCSSSKKKEMFLPGRQYDVNHKARVNQDK